MRTRVGCSVEQSILAGVVAMGGWELKNCTIDWGIRWKVVKKSANKQQNSAKITLVLLLKNIKSIADLDQVGPANQGLPIRIREQIRPGFELASKQTSRIQTGVSIKKLPIRNIESKEGPNRTGPHDDITINVPVAYMARDLMILKNSFRGPVEGVGPENRDFLGSWYGN